MLDTHILKKLFTALVKESFITRHTACKLHNNVVNPLWDVIKLCACFSTWKLHVYFLHMISSRKADILHVLLYEDFKPLLPLIILKTRTYHILKNLQQVMSVFITIQKIRQCRELFTGWTYEHSHLYFNSQPVKSLCISLPTSRILNCCCQTVEIKQTDGFSLYACSCQVSMPLYQKEMPKVPKDVLYKYWHDKYFSSIGLTFKVVYLLIKTSPQYSL